MHAALCPPRIEQGTQSVKIAHVARNQRKPNERVPSLPGAIDDGRGRRALSRPHVSATSQ